MVMVVADGGGEGEDSGGGSGERDGRRRRNHITVSHNSIFTPLFLSNSRFHLAFFSSLPDMTISLLPYYKYLTKSKSKPNLYLYPYYFP